ncbi:hypothetical protein ACTFIY_011294 [Dictyostelium cf. discoideum]
MKIENLILISILILFKILLINCSCEHDWQCGNSPYTRCRTNKTVIDQYDNRVDIDKVNGRLFFTVQYPDEFEKRVISIPVDGSNGNDVISHSTLYGQSTYQIIQGLIQYVGPISKSMVINRSVRIAGTTANIFYVNNTFGNELTWTVPGNFIFDEINNLQWTCWPYTNGVYKGKIGEYNNLGNQLYSGVVISIRAYQSSLLIQDGNGSIRNGNLNGPHAVISSLPMIFQDSNMGIFDVDDSSNRIFYTSKSDNKIYQVLISSTNQKKVILDIGFIPTFFKYHNNWLYYQQGGKIVRVSTNGDNLPQILFDSSSTDGHCICAQGFTGSSCNQCDTSKNIISWVNGIPRCIPLASDGNPITCDFNYQCLPYNVQTCKEIVLSGGNKGCST